MGLFSKFLKSTKAVVETESGVFTLVYSKGGKNIWSNSSTELTKSVKGTTSEPDIVQLAFIKNTDHEVEQLSEKLTHFFIAQFKEADVEANFSTWQERFKLISVDVEDIVNAQTYWTISFEDRLTPYAHFNLHLEGQEIKDMSMDT